MLEQIWHNLIQFTTQFVVPDWGGLIALLPIALLALVIVYLIWNVVRMATAPPKRRGVRRLDPLPPPGIHMPGPTFAPIFGAVGTFLLMFGLIAGGIALWLGVVALTLTLLYWGREALTDYDHIPEVAAEGGTITMLPAVVHDGPPAGVHMPGPSFRPILGAIGSTLLVFGFVVEGWFMVAGFVILAITLLGWLRDARREYVATVEADETGHIENGPAPRWPIPTLVAIVAIVAVAAVLTSNFFPRGTTVSPAPSAGASGAPPASGAPGSAAAPPPSAAPIAADVVITAHGIAWATPNVTGPAGKAFKLALDNQDPNVPHDIVIKDQSGGQVFKTEVVTGPKSQVFEAPVLQPGSYPFVCSIHPNMTGTLTAS
jgi:cupredoxin-like protein